MNGWLETLGLALIIFIILKIGAAVEENSWIDKVGKSSPIIINEKIYHCMEQP